MKKRWIIHPVREAVRDQISLHFVLSRICAQILVNRGLDTIEKVDKFLNITLKDLRDPFLLDGIEKAVERILTAVRNHETIVVHGDYDVDGITSTSLFCHVLRDAGVPVHFYIPNRLVEGYGLGEEGIQFALRLGASLVVTVDCGINAVSEVKQLKSHNIDVIITDHHMPGEVLPKAYAVVNPNIPDITYPFKSLAGVGVCFKLVHALLKKARELNMSEFDEIDLKDHLDLVALGTIADMMPLIDVNRIFVLYGLKRLSMTRKVGLQKLKEKAGIPHNIPMKTSHISFLMAPRINSVGRLHHADLGVDLLVASELDDAERLADLMEKSNRDRQKLEEVVFNEAKEYLEANPELKNRKIIIVAKEGWPVGLVSIVAARLTREFYKPAIVFSLEDGVGRGSARSVTCFNLLNGLKKCHNMLLEYGGHSYAAGLSIKENMIDEFSRKMNAIAEHEMETGDLLPEVFIDYKLHLADIGDELMKEIDRMAPFGQSNTRPVFLSQGLIVQGIPRFFGRNHIKFVVEEDGVIQDVIGFNMQKQLSSLTKGDKIDIVYSLHINDFNGIRSIQLQLADARVYK